MCGRGLRSVEGAILWAEMVRADKLLRAFVENRHDQLKQKELYRVSELAHRKNAKKRDTCRG